MKLKLCFVLRLLFQIVICANTLVTQKSFSAETGQILSDSTTLRKHVEYLCSYQNPRNVFNLSTLDSASQYIQSVFRKFSDRVDVQEYQVSYGIVRNIIVSFGPEDGGKIIIGAHYDVCGDQPGADDNASGIAGILELARLFSLVDSTKLKNNICLIAYTLEEPPYFRTEEMGSYIHAKSLHDKSVNVELMISLEMIGYFSEKPNSQKFPVGLLEWFYPTTGNFVALVSNFKSHSLTTFFKNKMRKYCNTLVEQITAPSFLTGVDFSDHLNYWNFGFQAFMITDTAFLRNNNYHEPTDTPTTLNYTVMSDIINGLFNSLLNY